MADRTVGNVIMQVLPSFRGAIASIEEEFTKYGEQAAQVFSKTFKETVGHETKDTPVGPSEEDSTRQGTASGGRFAEGFKARVDAALKALPDAKITADSSQADVKLAEIRSQLVELSDKKIGIDITDTAALAKLLELKVALKDIGASSESIQIKVDAAKATAELEAFKAVTDLASGSSGGGGLKELESAASNAGGGLSGMVNAALGLGPALIPILGVAVAGVGALLAPLTAATVGFGAFALAAAGSFTEVSQVFTSTLSNFQNDMQSTIQPVITGIEGAIVPLFSALTPLVDTTSTALTGLLDAGQRAFTAPFWQGFVTFLASQAGPAISSFGSLFGGIFKFLAGTMQAFAPIITDVEGGIASLGSHLASFGQNLGGSSGFQSFLSYVRGEAPVVGQLLLNLAEIIKNLVIALAPIGAVVLQVVTSLTGFLNVILQLLGPIGTTTALVGVGLIYAFSKIAPMVKSAGTALDIFRLSTLAVTDAGTGAAGGIGGLIATLGGLSAVALPVAIGVGLFAGALVLANLGGSELSATMQKLVTSVESLPTKSLPDLNTAISSTKAAIDKLSDSVSNAVGRFAAAGTHRVFGQTAEDLVQAGIASRTLTDYLGTLTTAQTNYVSNLHELKTGLGLSQSSAETMAQSLNINLHNALSPAQLVQFTASLKQQAEQTGLTATALTNMASAANTSTTNIASAVNKAVSTTTKAWASYGDAVTHFAGATTTVAASDISTFYILQETQAAQFAVNIQKAIADGYDPQTIANIVQAGPAKASQLLQGLVDAQGTGLNTLIAQASAAMSAEGVQAVETARIMQLAISSRTSQMTSELGQALAISQALTTANVTQSLQTVIAKYGGGLTALEQIASDYGIIIPNAIKKQIQAATDAANQQAQALPNAVTGATPATQNAGTVQALTFVGSIGARAVEAATAGAKLGGGAVTGITSVDFYTPGNHQLISLVDGLTDHGSNSSASNAGAASAGAAYAAVSATVSSFGALGRAIGAALSAGIIDGIGSLGIAGALAGAVLGAVEVAQATASSHPVVLPAPVQAGASAPHARTVATGGSVPIVQQRTSVTAANFPAVPASLGAASSGPRGPLIHADQLNLNDAVDIDAVGQRLSFLESAGRL